jgi:hypothetical protein
MAAFQPLSQQAHWGAWLHAAAGLHQAVFLHHCCPDRVFSSSILAQA